MFRAPRSLPSFGQLLDHLPGSDKHAAKYLGVTPRTIARWRAANEAPRVYELALYWESHWGVAHVAADAHNAAVHHARTAAILQREVDRLRGVILTLEQNQGWDSANSPVFKT